MNFSTKPKQILPKMDPKKIKKRIASSPISFMNAVKSPEKQPQQTIQNNVLSSQLQQNNILSTQSQQNNQFLNQPTNNQNENQNLELLSSSLDLDTIFGDLPQQTDSELDKLYQECSITSNIPINVLSACINFHINNFINNPSGFFENCL
jgi:hypothetical protein